MSLTWAIAVLILAVVSGGMTVIHELRLIRRRLKSIHFVQARAAGLEWTTEDAKSE